MAKEHAPYEIVSRWRVRGTINAVYAVLTDAVGLPRWWPEAYTSVSEIAPGDDRGKGRVSEIVTRGFLPYAVIWQLTVTDIDPPSTIRVEASGDVSGDGEWQLEQDGDDVVLVYTWRVRVDKAWMRRLEFLLKPLFVSNHKFVMRRGEAGLRRELARRARNQ